MIDYVVFVGVCIVDIVCVCLGVYVGEGIIVMYEGFINFNVGIEGSGMIEGCIFVGVFVGKGFDLGGSFFIMGILFGGGNIVIFLGENCLFGVNVGIGILLGDCCIIEVGLYIIVGIKVEVLDQNGKVVDIVKVCDLVGQFDLLFCCDLVSGVVQCQINKIVVVFNEELYKYN